MINNYKISLYFKYYLILIYIVTLLFVLISSTLNEGMNPWKNCDYDPGPWCEWERTFNLIREPSNSYSDFGYLALSFYMFYKGSKDYCENIRLVSNLIVENPLISFLGGFLNLIHFIGTFGNHSSRCHKFH